jgi:glycosyltransferase involved in cell wall biosynthesis
MRFVILTQYYQPEIGAAQVRLANMTQQLIENGHEVEVVTAMPNYPTGKILPKYQKKYYMREEINGVKVHRVWIYAATGAGTKRLLNYTSFMLMAFIGLNRSQKPDYIFVESPPLFLGMTGYIASKWWNVPFIFNVSDLWPDSIKALGLKKEGMVLKILEKLEAFLYRKAAYVNTLAQGIRHILQTEKKVASEKILYLPNGVNIKTFYPMLMDTKWQKNLGLPIDKHIILYAGTHGYAHGLETLLETARLLREDNVLFLCVGGGSEKSRIHTAAIEMRLNNMSFWQPQAPEMINRLYSLALAGISTFRHSPLLEQTLPAKILPIMACGKPVLYSGAGEGAKLIEDAQAGIVTPPENAPALAAAIRKLVENKEYAQQLGQNGQQYIEQHLQWSLIVKNWLQQLNANK